MVRCELNRPPACGLIQIAVPQGFEAAFLSGGTVRKRRVLALIGAASAMALTGSVQAAISVPAGGITEQFNTLPSNSNWSSATSTATPAGSNAAAITNDTLANQAMAAIAPTSITTALTSVTAYTAANQVSQYHSTDQRIFTFPTGNNATIVMATLTNDTGASATNLDVAWQLTNVASGSTTQNEELPGHRVYYNLTGLANGWVPAAAGTFNTGLVNGAAITFPVGPQNKSFSATGLSVGAGSTLYVAFLDDNGAGSATTGELANILDNVSFTLSDASAPEPATLGLASIVGFGLLARRRNKV